jgi:hypothetical protein
MLYLSIRSVLTGHLSEIRSVGSDIGTARAEAIALADTMLANSVWLTAGNPTSKYSALLETFPAARV